MLIEIDEVIQQLRAIQRFNLDNYVENEYSVETIRVEDIDGDYIEAYDIDYMVDELEKKNEKVKLIINKGKEL